MKTYKTYSQSFAIIDIFYDLPTFTETLYPCWVDSSLATQDMQYEYIALA